MNEMQNYQDYIVAYGSLMNRYSRETYSNIYSEVIPLELHGWSRSWSASYPDEGATYAGAVRTENASLNGVLLPTEINENIRQRERGYTFVELDLADFVLSEPLTSIDRGSSVDNARFWICELNSPASSSQQNPLPQSYVDTCVHGCLETGGIDSAKQFIELTSAWDGYWLNDRGVNPIYPRSSPLEQSDYKLIDGLLGDCGVLAHRQAEL